MPNPIVYAMGRMLRGFERLKSLADSPGHIIPVHDPLVMTRYPAATPALDGTVVRLDADPER